MQDKHLIQLRSEPVFGTITGSQIERISKNDIVLRDVVAATANMEAIGHGIMTDMQSIIMLAQLGNQNPKAIPTRFGHPGMSENAMGKRVGKSFNWRIAGDRLLSDIEMLSTARKSPVFTQDPIEYIIEMAANHPDEMGMSLVIDTDLVWIMPDGSEVSMFDLEDEEPPEGAINELPMMRPIALYYNDVVGEGALTPDGMFTALTASGYSEAAFTLIDEWRNKFGIALDEIHPKVDTIIKTYLRMRGGNTMALKKGTVKRFEDSPMVDVDAAILENTPEAESPADEETSPDPVDQALAGAEETAEVLHEDEQEQDEQTAAQLAIMQAQISQLQEQVEKLAKLAVILNSNVQVLTRRVKRLETEPVVRDRVVIGADLAAQEPHNVAQRMGVPSNAVANSLARNIKRKQKHGL